ncbi:MAG: sensor histidine kinase [Oceanococcus sp.]
MKDRVPYLPLFRALVENAQDLLGVMDLQGQIRYLNPASQILGRGRARDQINRPIQTLCQPQDRPLLENWLANLRRSNERQLCELHLGVESNWRLMQLSGVPVLEEEGQQVIVVSGHDITTEHAAAKALKASEKRYHGAFDYSPIGKALIASDGLVVEANRALSDMLDCWVSELLGSNLFSKLDEESRHLLEEDAAILMLKRDEVRERELQRRRPGQAQQWLLINMAPIWTDSGKLQHFILQMQDVTARRQAEQNLRESNADLLRSNEELKRFAFIASHDLREPLRGIGGSIQLIARRYKETLSGDGQELAAQAVAGVKRLQSLLDELVSYAEQMRGGELSRQSIAVSSIVRELVQEFSEEIGRQDASVEIGELPSLLGDADQIRQIFRQLIDNALKFARVGVAAKIKLSARWAQGAWEFCVEDNGMGIDVANQEQIFEVFRRLNPDIAGTGMGLATVRKIIERHGGRIWVESQAGQGSRFYFKLPPE